MLSMNSGESMPWGGSRFGRLAGNFLALLTAARRVDSLSRTNPKEFMTP